MQLVSLTLLIFSIQKLKKDIVRLNRQTISPRERLMVIHTGLFLFCFLNVGGENIIVYIGDDFEEATQVCKLALTLNIFDGIDMFINGCILVLFIYMADKFAKKVPSSLQDLIQITENEH